MKNIDLDVCKTTIIHAEKVDQVQTELKDKDFADLLVLSKCLGDSSRVQLLYALATYKEMCVCDLAAATGIEQSAVSHNLRLLRSARIVRFRREGKQVFYTLDDDHVAGLLRQGIDHARHSNPREEDDA